MNAFNHYEGKLSHIIDFRCDPVFAQAIEHFHEQASRSNYYLGTKRNSVFNLVKELLDPAFKNAYLLKDVAKDEELVIGNHVLLPSSIMNLPHGYEFDPKDENMSGYERSNFVIDKWLEHLEFLENLAEGPVETGMILTLRKLSIHLKQYKPREEYLPFNKDTDEMFRTQCANKKLTRYCVLCWRETERFQNYTDGLYIVEYRGSSKFCSEHLPFEGINMRSPYQQDHRLKQDFDNELMSLINPGTSTFLPNFSWFSSYFPGLSEAERRKLAYRLVHSKLNSKSKRALRNKILTLLAKNEPRATICEKVGLTRSSLDRQIKTIVEEIRRVLSWPFLNDDGTRYEEDPLVRRLKLCSVLLDRAKVRNNATRKMIQRCYHRHPDLPSLDIILRGVRKSKDKVESGKSEA